MAGVVVVAGGCGVPPVSVLPSQSTAAPSESTPTTQPPATVWELVPLPALPGVQLNDIAHGNRAWVAVGGPIPTDVGTSEDPPKGVVLFSTDGADWARVDAPDLAGAFGINAVAAANDGGFVAVGSGRGPAATWHSPDGRSWTLGEPAIDFGQAGLLDVTAVADGFVAVGFVNVGGKQLPASWHSVDGRRWAPSGPIGQEAFGAFRAILATKDGMIAGGTAQSDVSAMTTARLWHSSDGQSWAPLSLGAPGPTGFVEDLAATQSMFVAVGGNVTPDAAAVWLSEDGERWRAVASQATLEGIAGMEEADDVAGFADALLAVGGPACCGAPPSAWISSDGSRWVRVRLENLAGHLSAVSAEGAMALVVGYRGLAAAIWRVGLAQ